MLKYELNYWLWCRWFGHKGPIDTDVLEKKGRPDIVLHYCVACNRIPPRFL